MNTKEKCVCGSAVLTLVLLTTIAVGVWTMPSRMMDERDERT